MKGVSSFVGNRDLQIIYDEIISRIRQEKTEAKRDDSERVFSTIGAVLDALDEPEFQEKHKP